MKNRKAAIATILMVGALVLMGVAAVTTSLNLNQTRTTASRASEACKPQKCGSLSTNSDAGYSSMYATGGTQFFEKGGCTKAIPQGVGTYCKSQNTAPIAPPASGGGGTECEYDNRADCVGDTTCAKCTTVGCKTPTAKCETRRTPSAAVSTAPVVSVSPKPAVTAPPPEPVCTETYNVVKAGTSDCSALCTGFGGYAGPSTYNPTSRKCCCKGFPPGVPLPISGGEHTGKYRCCKVQACDGKGAGGCKASEAWVTWGGYYDSTCTANGLQYCDDYNGLNDGASGCFSCGSGGAAATSNCGISNGPKKCNVDYACTASTKGTTSSEYYQSGGVYYQKNGTSCTSANISTLCGCCASGKMCESTCCGNANDTCDYLGTSPTCKSATTTCKGNGFFCKVGTDKCCSDNYECKHHGNSTAGEGGDGSCVQKTDAGGVTTGLCSGTSHTCSVNECKLVDPSYTASNSNVYWGTESGLSSYKKNGECVKDYIRNICGCSTTGGAGGGISCNTNSGTEYKCGVDYKCTTSTKATNSNTYFKDYKSEGGVIYNYCGNSTRISESGSGATSLYGYCGCKSDVVGGGATDPVVPPVVNPPVSDGTCKGVTCTDACKVFGQVSGFNQNTTGFNIRNNQFYSKTDTQCNNPISGESPLTYCGCGSVIPSPTPWQYEVYHKISVRVKNSCQKAFTITNWTPGESGYWIPLNITVEPGATSGSIDVTNGGSIPCKPYAIMWRTCITTGGSCMHVFNGIDCNKDTQWTFDTTGWCG